VVEILLSVVFTIVGALLGHYLTKWDAERQSENTRQQILDDIQLELNTSLDSPKNALERLDLAERELAQARKRYNNARNRKEKRGASLVVATRLRQRLKVAQQLDQFQRPSLAYGKLKEETDRELDGLKQQI
jgi:exonuclease VII small subunit